MADPIYFGDGIKLACCPTTLESLYIAASGCCSNYYTAFLGGEQSYSIVYTLPTASGSSGQVLTTDNNGNLSWQNNSGGGGTGSPAGSDGYIQYNNGGSFGGASIVYWDDISRRLGIGTSSPNQTLEVAGTMRLTGSTGTSSSILGRSSVGDISSIAIGSGLSLSGNTLISSGGLPASGLTGQILAKNSGSNYDVSWVDNITAVQHMQQYIKNNQGATVSKGQAVYIDGADGTNATIKLAQANSEATSSKTLGLLEQNLAINVKGYVVTEGLLSGIDTSGANAEGDPVWLDPNNAGGLIFGLTNKPVAPAHLVYLGVVIRKNNVNGEIYVKVQNGYELQELHNVLIPSSVTNNDVLAYETSTSLWKNKSFTSLGLVSGTGTTNYIPKWDSGTSLADSVIFQSGTSVGIGTTTLSSDRLDIQGTTASQGGQIGAELMTTGSGTNWTGTSFALGYTHTTGSTFALTSTVSVASSAYYQVSYTITGRTAGTINVSVGGVTSGAVSVSGSLVQSITSATAVTVTPTTDFDGAIILSVKQITASTMATFALKNSSGTVVYEQRAAASNTNIFQGVGAGSLNTTGINNIFKGFEAGLNNTTGSDNTFIGRLSGKFNTTGSNNVFNGSSAGRSNTIGATNSFIGCNAGQNSTTGSGNVFIGSSAGLNNTSGAENISIGIDAGRFIANATAATTNVGCIALGGDTRTLLNGETNATVIGYKARGLGSNTTVIGSSATIQTWLGGKLSVGTTGNTAYLNVQGSGSTSATTSLLIQNSATTPLLTIKDDGAATFSAQTGTATTGTTNFVTLDHSIAASGAGNANFRPLNIGYTINNTGAQSGNTTGIFLNATATALGGMTHNLIEAQLGAMSIFKVNQNGVCSTYFLDLAGNNQNKGLYMPAGGNTSILSNFNSVQLQAYNGTAYVTALFMSGGGVGEIRTNIGSVAAVASARLQVDSTTKGFLPPRMSSSNRDAISPIDGLEIYNNSINAKQVYSTGVTNEWKTVDTALQSLVATGGTLNILFKNGNVANVALNDSTIFTFSNAAVGVYIINLKQGVGGSFTVTWPTIKWAGGIPPTLTATAGKYDIITLIYDGINYYGTASLNF